MEIMDNSMSQGLNPFLSPLKEEENVELFDILNSSINVSEVKVECLKPDPTLVVSVERGHIVGAQTRTLTWSEFNLLKLKPLRYQIHWLEML